MIKVTTEKSTLAIELTMAGFVVTVLESTGSGLKPGRMFQGEKLSLLEGEKGKYLLLESKPPRRDGYKSSPILEIQH